MHHSFDSFIQMSTVTCLKVMPWQRDMNHPSLLISYRQRKVEVTSTLDTFIFCFHYTVNVCSQILLTWFMFPRKHEKTTHAWPQVCNSVLNASQIYWNAEKQTSYTTIFVGVSQMMVTEDDQCSLIRLISSLSHLFFSLEAVYSQVWWILLHTAFIWSVNAVKMFQQWRLY